MLDHSCITVVIQCHFHRSMLLKHLQMKLNCMNIRLASILVLVLVMLPNKVWASFENEWSLYIEHSLINKEWDYIDFEFNENKTRAKAVATVRETDKIGVFVDTMNGEKAGWVDLGIDGEEEIVYLDFDVSYHFVKDGEGMGKMSAGTYLFEIFDFDPSDASQCRLVVKKYVAPVTFSLIEGEEYAEGTTFELACETKGADIYWSKGVSYTRYTSPIVLGENGTTTYRAYAQKDWTKSETAEMTVYAAPNYLCDGSTPDGTMTYSLDKNVQGKVAEHVFSAKVLSEEPDADGLYHYVCAGNPAHLSEESIIQNVAEGGINIVLEGNSTDGYTAGEVTLTDDVPFESPVVFKAETVEYSRDLSALTSTDWGSLYLPFAIHFDEAGPSINFYTLKNADAASITFEQVEATSFAGTGTIPACMPILFKRASDGVTSLSFELEDVIVSTLNGQTPTGGDITMKGTCQGLIFTGLDNDQTKHYYYLGADQKFHRALKKLTVNPFRVWFESENIYGDQNQARALMIDDGETHIAAVMDADGSVYDIECIFNAQGNRIDQIQQGVNILHLKDGSIRKIMSNK